jgi:predicted transcriptional regulator
MKISEILEVLNGRTLQPNGKIDADIKYAFAADLMSDVLFVISRKAEPVLLITGVTNPSVVRTAAILDIPVILIVRGKQVPKETIDIARENKIIVLHTDHIMFVTCALLNNAGLEGAPWKMK